MPETTVSPRKPGGYAGRPSLRSVEERNRIVEANLYLVLWVLKRCRRKRIDEEEAECAGREGLIRAAELWEPEKGAFSTCAVWWVRQAINRADRSATVIHVPIAMQCGHPGDPKKQHCRAKHGGAAARALACLSFSPRPAGRGEGEILPGVPEPAAREAPRDGVDADELAALGRALRRVPTRQRRVLRMRFWDGLTLKEIGAKLGVTRERVRQLEVKALARLREVMTGLPSGDGVTR